MRIFLINTYLAILLIGCNNNFNGKIEERFGSYYLVNTSSSETFRFTIKKTQTQDSSIHIYTTDLILLAPGDEKLLGEKYFEKTETFEAIADTSTSGNSLSIEIFAPTSEQIAESKARNKRKIIKNKLSEDELFDEAFKEAVRNEHDTIIGGRLMMYRYVHKTKQPIDSVHKFYVIFEITGQTKINPKK